MKMKLTSDLDVHEKIVKGKVDVLGAILLFSFLLSPVPSWGENNDFNSVTKAIISFITSTLLFSSSASRSTWSISNNGSSMLSTGALRLYSQSPLQLLTSIFSHQFSALEEEAPSSTILSHPVDSPHYLSGLFSLFVIFISVQFLSLFIGDVIILMWNEISSCIVYIIIF